MTGYSSRASTDRVVERRRAVALARHYREFEGLSIRQIADRLGRSPATVKAYFYDPTGEKARAVKARYVGVCRGCGAYTQPRNGKGDAYAYCKACHPGAIEQRWTRERVLEAMRAWRGLNGRLPTSYDWSRTHARRRGGEALRRLNEGSWPSASVVTAVWGSWSAARSAVGDAVSRAGQTSATDGRREVVDASSRGGAVRKRGARLLVSTGSGSADDGAVGDHAVLKLGRWGTMVCHHVARTDALLVSIERFAATFLHPLGKHEF